MKQLKTIEQLQKMFPNITGIDIALLYGSFGRNEPTPNSDIDIQLLVNNEFDNKFLIDELQKEFHSEIFSIREVAMRSKVVVYFTSQPKIEFALCTNISEIDRNYLGSEISNIADTILYVKQNSKYEIKTYLHKLVRDYNQSKSAEANAKQVADLIDKFVYEFENCSTMHRRSDSYQFYFFYNIALHVAIQLNHLSKGNKKFNFLPKYYIANILTKEEQAPFYGLKGTLFLPEANQQKRRLLDFFYSAIENLVDVEKLEELRQCFEWIYERDFLWNFRDISTHNPKIKSGRIFRTATMTFFQNENRFDELLQEKKIKTVIDLRADKEIDEMPYSENSLSKFKYVKTQLDPWNQPDWFKENHHQGTNEQIAYRFFAIACSDKIKKAMEAIINEQGGSVAIHCFAGKDRTGIFISMLHLLAETPIEIINTDYLASEVDVKLQRLNLVLNIIEEKGGIEPYLIGCGLSENQITKLKSKLLD
ncbi:MAG: tyrosine-protein phosphatase [Arcicella sp.]|jgi:predicted nucleotidyltransferase|nr:tyrosine-protein phosphatase [Microscillaceae bacterium]MCU0469138.1 tyrosine-protein phosphatase [Arcicella sp.]